MTRELMPKNETQPGWEGFFLVTNTVLGFFIYLCKNEPGVCLPLRPGRWGHQSQESPGVVCNQENPGPQPFANLFFTDTCFNMV